MKGKIVCKNTQDSVGVLMGLTQGKYYKVIDEDNIGYMIRDDLDKLGWYCKELFFQKEELRESIISFFLAESEPINVLDYSGNNTGVQYMSNDIISVLLKELKELDNFTVKINSIHHLIGIITNKSIWRISYTYSDGKFLASNMADIVDFDVKMRDLKIGNII